MSIVFPCNIIVSCFIIVMVIIFAIGFFLDLIQKEIKNTNKQFTIC